MATLVAPNLPQAHAELDVRERLIVALDFPHEARALDLLERLEGRCRWCKVGLELFLASGPALIEKLRRRNLQVFVDLKLHDIPNTVAGAVRTLASVGASMTTIHTSGGQPMLEAASRAASETPGAPQLLGVTVLTSMDQAVLRQIGVQASIKAQVVHLATLAHEAGFAGMVCSTREISELRSTLGPKPLLVIPGIRLPGTELPGQALDDQSRIASPGEAVLHGASYLVIGRPINRAADPAAAFDAYAADIARNATES